MPKDATDIAKIRSERPRQSGILRCFLRARRGTTAVEFALLSIPFFMLLGSIIEVGLLSLNSAALKNGVREAARAGRVGTAACMDAEEMREMICTSAKLLADCENRLSVNQKRIEGWGGDAGSQVGANDNDTVNGGDIIVARAVYEWKVISPFMGEIMGASEGVFEFAQSFAYQAEPYGASNCK
ncbi:MAG: pilus assembly protein [Neomegalonema sp.]|nr:pilus assembly protein [Neomegalonema sp.]